MTIHTAHQAIALAQASLEHNEVLLTPQAGSPLASLVNVADAFNWSFDHISTLAQDEQVDALAQMVDDETVSEMAPSVDHHNGQMVRDIAAAVTTHISYAKNTVLPLVLQYQNQVQEVMETPDSLVNKFNVIVTDLPEVMQDYNFRAEVEKLSAGGGLEPEKQVTIPCEGPSFVCKYLQTGAASTDKQIALWCTSLGDERLVKLWDFFYGKGQGSIIAKMNNKDDGVEYALFAFLTARRLYDDVPDGVAMTLVEYRRYILQYTECAAQALRNAYGREDALDKSGIVVSTYNKFNYDVRVNGKTYREYLKQGGKNEVIFGSMYAGATAQTINDLLGKTDEYYQLYSRQEAIISATRRLQTASVFKGALKTIFNKLLSDVSTEEAQAHTTFGLTTAVIATRVQDVIESLSTDELKDVNAACLKVMCRARFEYTDAEKFFTSMNEAQQANPSLDAREVAHIATIELITDYVSDQIIATRVR